ncbi:MULTISPECIES: PP2C family serine/threonine-protein phosphatase [Burkholderiaceae]|uniref:Serine/threonine protein phosphatase n=1 Tax=Caballeronia zhejiangensis TaxID=871203 RepID=A0A656QHH6_9BURK|nr:MULTISPECIES: PP2C family serine/threonine-protein phosphatase [Burkholderiaceae]KAK43925.1 serine/threonine protein phosphatase [Caballeronia jiangsuensis]KDR28780.1 serine/threonine protein phosphatase [Caballeronia zhejiangensis]KWU19240.1 hypothetical protein AS149_13460 [Burkholderia cenocepacia]SAL57948.1 hypothetical protein AWB71_03167 [Caballeronia peredens]
MTWKTVSASVVGTSHTQQGGECQDTCLVQSLIDRNQQQRLVCLLSDGAGSARFAAKGADLACSTALTAIEHTFKTTNHIDGSAVEGWICAVRAAVTAAANESDATSRDYACTLLGAVLGPESSVFFQIGDGAIVVASEDVQGVVFWPEAGRYANMTNFVTDDDSLMHLQIAVTSSPAAELALFSDGLQRLALTYESQTPYSPFFDPMFFVLRRKSLSECEALTVQLAQFLDSKQVNERTDDDKTLVLATRRVV